MKRLAFLALIAPLVLGAQTIQKGSIVRVWSADSTLVSRMLKVGSVAGDTLLLLDGLNPMQRRLSSLHRVELQVQRTPEEGAGHYLRVGFVTGAVVGLGTGIALMANGVPCDDGTRKCYSVPAFVLPFVLGTTGALVGHAFGSVARGSVWRCVPDAPCNKR